MSVFNSILGYHILSVISSHLELLRFMAFLIIGVTFVSTSSKEPVRYLLTLNKQDKVVKLKEQLLKSIGQDAPKNIALAEVLDSHIARTLVSN